MTQPLQLVPFISGARIQENSRLPGFTRLLEGDTPYKARPLSIDLHDRESGKAPYHSLSRQGPHSLRK